MKLVPSRTHTVRAGYGGGAERPWYEGPGKYIAGHWKPLALLAAGAAAVAVGGFGKKLHVTPWDVYTALTQPQAAVVQQTDGMPSLKDDTIQLSRTFYTADGIKYVICSDGNIRCFESADGLTRVEGPSTLSDKDTEFYLEKAYKANKFVAKFFDWAPTLPMLMVLSPDGQQYNIIEFRNAAKHGWRPDHYIHGTVNDPNVKIVLDHDEFVHVISHEWVNRYLRSADPTSEFWAQYLGNASVFVKNGGEPAHFTLRNCKPCLRHDSYFDGNGNLKEAAQLHMSLSPELDPNAWGFGMQLVLENQDGLGFAEFRELARVQAEKFRQKVDNLTPKDYQKTRELVRK